MALALGKPGICQTRVLRESSPHPPNPHSIFKVEKKKGIFLVKLFCIFRSKNTSDGNIRHCFLDQLAGVLKSSELEVKGSNPRLPAM